MQPTLFNLPLAAAGDPPTSHEAGERVTRSGQRLRHAAIVLELVRQHPGSTAVELHALQSRQDAPESLDRHEISRRLADLKNSGLVSQGAARTCSVRKTKMVTWTAT